MIHLFEIYEESRIEEALKDPTLQMALFPSVVYTTGQLLDLKRLCLAARNNGVIIGLDMSHSVGLMQHFLDEWGADFAGWGHYKWLNAGPGAVAGLYLNRRHFDPNGFVAAGLAGWWSVHKESMFEMSDEFFPGLGASALQIGTPAVLSMAPIDGAKLNAIADLMVSRWAFAGAAAHLLGSDQQFVRSGQSDTVRDLRPLLGLFSRISLR